MWPFSFSLKKSSSSLSHLQQSLPIPVLKTTIPLATANEHKSLGNAHFSKKSLDKAIQEYSAGIDCFEVVQEDDATDDWMPSHLGDAPETILLSLLLSNRAACYIQLSKWTDAVRDANLIIQMRPDWVKGYYRRAEALYQMNEYAGALHDYKAAASKDPADTHIQFKIQKTNVKKREKESGLMVHQLLSGRDLCLKSVFSPIQNMIFDFAVKMSNFVYLIVRSM